MKMVMSAAALVSLIAIAMGSVTALADNDDRDGRNRPVEHGTTKAFQYLVKGLCNGPEGSPLAQAIFKTETNIVNANDAPTLVLFRSATPGEPPSSGNLVIEPFGSVATACTTANGAALPFSEGLTIWTGCKRPLTITVVYTAEKDDGSVGIDVEQIVARKVRLNRSDCLGAE